MPDFLPLSEAIRSQVGDGCMIALEGFSHLIPFAAGHEIIRQGIKHLTLVRLTPDIIYDQMVGMGCADKLVFSWCGNPGVGSLYRIRDAIENDWPHRLELDERSHAAMTVAYSAGASKLPLGIYRGLTDGDLEQRNPNIKPLFCPFTEEKLAAVTAVNPDTTIVHAQCADRQGNVHIRGIIGIQREIALAAAKLVVTVEEIVDSVDASPNDCVIPHWAVDAICEVPGGAYPSYADGYYVRDNDFYTQWGEVSQSRTAFQAWMQEHVMQSANHREFLRLISKKGSMPS